MRSPVTVSATTTAVLALSLATSGPAAAGGTHPGGGHHGGGGPRDALTQETATELGAVVDSGTPGVGVARLDGRRAQLAGAGVAEVTSGRAFDPTDRFYAGSTTKTFVAATVLRLAEQGKLNLDDTVERWLPGLVPNGSAISLRLLLNHRSGLAEYTDDPTSAAPVEQDPDHRFTLEALAKFALTKAPVAAPGTAFNYSNTNYVLAGLVIERATGKPWTKVVERETIRRAGLRHTYLAEARIQPEPFLHGYLLVEPGQPLIEATGLLSATYTGSAGQVVSTLEDLARFSRQLIGGELLKDDSLAQMQQVLPVEGTDRLAYGLGLYRQQTDCGPAWGHDGEVFGTSTLALSTPDARRQVVTVANRGLPDEDAYGKRQQLFAKAFCAAPTPGKPKAKAAKHAQRTSAAQITTLDRADPAAQFAAR